MMKLRTSIAIAATAVALTTFTACNDGGKPDTIAPATDTKAAPAGDNKGGLPTAANKTVPAAPANNAAPAAAPNAAPAAANNADPAAANNAAPAAGNNAAPAAANKETGKVTTTASGLKYEVLKEGEGPKPSATDNVTVHYKGTLTDGTVFDSSYDRGQPATFPLNRVIKGWTEGVQLMSPGSKYKFTIPPELGYGAAGAGGKIPPNATLIFEVELIKIG
jgi:FKBP-type peptidyl-prolyl cis-trans isomerase